MTRDQTPVVGRPNSVRSPRLKIKLQVFDKHRDALAFTRDISQDGIFVETSQPLDVGTRTVLRLTLPNYPVPLEVPAECVRTEPRPQSGMGMKLLHTQEAQRHFLGAQLQILKQNAIV